MHLIVGLGNPGEKYQNTRHNAGFMALDLLAQQLEAQPHWNELKRSHSQVLETKTGAKKVTLAKPTTYMNLSGQAVSSLLGHYKLKAKDLIVIYDDFDLPLGALRVRKSGSSGGHNGVQSVINMLKTEEFTRVRIGIGDMDDPAFLNKTIPREDYVLMPFTDEETSKLAPVLEKATEAVRIIIEHSVEYYLSNIMSRA